MSMCESVIYGYGMTGNVMNRLLMKDIFDYIKVNCPRWEEYLIPEDTDNEKVRAMGIQEYVSYADEEHEVDLRELPFLKLILENRNMTALGDHIYSYETGVDSNDNVYALYTPKYAWNMSGLERSNVTEDVIKKDFIRLFTNLGYQYNETDIGYDEAHFWG